MKVFFFFFLFRLNFELNLRLYIFSCFSHWESEGKKRSQLPNVHQNVSDQFLSQFGIPGGLIGQPCPLHAGVLRHRKRQGWDQLGPKTLVLSMNKYNTKNRGVRYSNVNWKWKLWANAGVEFGRLHQQMM